MTSAQIRQSFLNFFNEKQHTIVPSSSLMPDSPNLLFTNAGMNQFVPIFLGQKSPDVSKWAGSIPGSDQRAADTQKCIRAGGKHNDLEDVGKDTYHHTFFEMLGNWSFGDYFKQESIRWGFELLTKVYGLDPNRLYATWCAGDPKQGVEPDHESRDLWLKYLPADHVIPGSMKDNFWEMGETGPCGPSSELFIDYGPDLGPEGGPANPEAEHRYVEIWNLVFTQFNRVGDPPDNLRPLPSKKGWMRTKTICVRI